MKNNVTRFLLVIVLSVGSVAMEEGGKERENVESSSWVSSTWSVTKRWILPTVAFFGGAYAAKECRGEIRGLGGAGAFYGGKNLGQNLWNLWRHGDVEGADAVVVGKLNVLRNEYEGTQIALGAVLWETLTGDDTGKKDEFNLDAIENLDIALLREKRDDLEAQETMVLAMQEALKARGERALYVGQMEVVQDSLLSEEEKYDPSDEEYE